MLYCSACGTQNQSSSQFCSNCGVTLELQEGPAKGMERNVGSGQSQIPNQQPVTAPNPAQQQQIHVNIAAPQPSYQQPANIIRIGQRKDPTAAALISLFFPGLGYAYFGQTGKGILMFFAIIFLYFIIIGFFLHIYSIFNSYSECKKYNYLNGYTF